MAEEGLLDKEAFNPLQAAKNIGKLGKHVFQGAGGGAAGAKAVAKGAGGLASQAAKKNPLAAAGAAGLAGLGAGYAAGK